jgi:hypothetical protein
MEAALQTMINNMSEKTGKSIDDWKVILKEKSFTKHGEALNFLKKEFGVSHGFANTIVSLSRNTEEVPESLIATQYSGKDALVPIYEALISIVKDFGDDVKVTPKKTSVSIIRRRQFALIKPATRTSIDLGLKFTSRPIGGRLEGSGPFGTMCTHRVKLGALEEIDDELRSWLMEAYQVDNTVQFVPVFSVC